MDLKPILLGGAGSNPARCTIPHSIVVSITACHLDKGSIPCVEDFSIKHYHYHTKYFYYDIFIIYL